MIIPITSFGSGNSFIKKINQYIAFCQENHKIPNMYGFCRYSNLSQEELLTLESQFPHEFGIMKAIFYDEVLNHTESLTSSMITTLFKLYPVFFQPPSTQTGLDIPTTDWEDGA